MASEKHCCIPRCRSDDYDVMYLGYPICERCWDKYANDIHKLKKLLNSEKVVANMQNEDKLSAEEEITKKEKT